MMKKLSIFLMILAVTTGALAQTGYRDLPWGLKKKAVAKSVFDWFDAQAGEMEQALVYNGNFQSVDATYKFLFESDSLYLVGISATLPYNLLESGEFKSNFRKSEAFVDGLISRLNQKYGKARLSEKLDTDLFSSWRDDETDIELIVTRNTQYTIVLTYTWRNFLERRKSEKEGNWKDEL
jgi:hypothetical protein